jgi:hypothetical protein
MPNSFRIMQVSVISTLSVFILFSIIPFPLNQNQHAYSQTFKTNSAATSTADVKSGKGVDLTNIHTSPSNVKVHSRCEIWKGSRFNKYSYLTIEYKSSQQI